MIKFRKPIDNVTDGSKEMDIVETLASRFDELPPLEFYRELFPPAELDERDAFTQGKYCGIALEIVDRNKVKRFTICDDLSPLPELLDSNNFVVISPLSYAGKVNNQQNARFLYSLTFDLDGLKTANNEPVGLNDLLHQSIDIDLLPRPTFIVASGSNIHLYYLLERPLALFDNVKKQLRNYRNALIPKLWNQYVTDLHESPQFESLSQGFRAVGSICKDGKNRVRAFRTGERVSIEYLNQYVDEDHQIKEFSYKSNLTLKEAKEKYPDWYQERIIDKKPVGTWKVKRDLYDWWLRKIKEGAVIGHRYFCIMSLAVFAKKCSIELDELEKDAYGLLGRFDDLSVSEDNRFTLDDINAALQAYSDDYITLTRDAIAKLSGIEMHPNKRNYLPQEVHLRIARSTKQIKKQAGLMKKEGRPSKQEIVFSEIKANPDQSVTELAQKLQCSKSTIYKYKKLLSKSN